MQVRIARLVQEMREIALDHSFDPATTPTPTACTQKLVLDGKEFLVTFSHATLGDDLPNNWTLSLHFADGSDMPKGMAVAIKTAFFYDVPAKDVKEEPHISPNGRKFWAFTDTVARRIV